MNHEMTLEVAEAMIYAAKSKATQLKILEDIAVVDATGTLKAFARMDGPGSEVSTSRFERLERPVILIWRHPKSARCRRRASPFTPSSSAMAA